jgi:hypothetical protein
MPFDAFAYRPDHPDIETMRAARDMVAFAWTKGAYHVLHKGIDGYCAVAAIATAAGAANYGRGFLSPTAKRLVRELASDLPPTGSKAMWRLKNARGRVILFNDHRKTMKSNVVAAFDRTIMRMVSEVALTRL